MLAETKEKHYLVRNDILVYYFLTEDIPIGVGPVFSVVAEFPDYRQAAETLRKIQHQQLVDKNALIKSDNLPAAGRPPADKLRLRFKAKILQLLNSDYVIAFRLFVNVFFSRNKMEQ
jgi:hypothetical protein